MLAQVTQAQPGLLELSIILIYLLMVAYLGWLGWSRTRTGTDYLVAGRKAHPAVMALSYGATFISTSAIVGFGGIAGMFGMSLLWLAMLNIAVGVFVAFIFLGGPTRRMGHILNAHTFPEFMGKRYQSRFVHVFAAAVILLFMPLYASAVLSGGSKFTALQFGIPYDTALLIFALITAAYVIAGGLKAVMYTDTLQGVIMLLGMIILLVFTYVAVGGITQGHRDLTELQPLTPPALIAQGHRGWTAMPEFGWGVKTTAEGLNPQAYNLWWTIVSSIILGVGIGVLAQPQLVVRFMTVRSKMELNRAVPIGAFFILIMVGVPYVAGPLSNAYFTRHGSLITGKVVRLIDRDKGYAIIQPMQPDETGRWVEASSHDGRSVRKPMPMVLDGTQASLTVTNAEGGTLELVRGRGIALAYTPHDDLEEIMPTFITTALPRWFGLLFFLTLLSAGMSTLSSQLHTLGSAAGRDIYENFSPRAKASADSPRVLVVRVAIVLGLIVAVAISHFVQKEALIARFTAIFFGLCAATFLPAYLGGLFWKRMTAAGAAASMVSGCLASLFWLLLIKEKEASALGLVQKLTGGKTSLLAAYPNWPMVDPVLVALPLAALVGLVVSLMTAPPPAEHLSRCFGAGHEPQSASSAGTAANQKQVP